MPFRFVKLIFLGMLLTYSCQFSGGVFAQAENVMPAVSVEEQQKDAMDVDVRAVRDHNVRVFDVQVDQLDQLVSGQTIIKLWGVDQIDIQAPVLLLKARNALENKIGNAQVRCDVLWRASSGLRAQCENSLGEDLGLFLLNEGYAHVNRQDVSGTLFESAYLNAQKVAEDGQKGFWAGESGSGVLGVDMQGKKFVVGAFIIIGLFVVAIIFLSVYIMRGFGRVVEIQNQSLNLAAKERNLRDKEKEIIASLIHSEIRENRPKIEAYLMVYEEMLRDFSSGGVPKCMQTGEVIQKQPALSRGVFDGNTGKLDHFDQRLASDLIHYYARIKSSPDYIEITSNMDVNDARNVVQSCVDQVKKLNEITDHLMICFSGDVFDKDAS